MQRPTAEKNGKNPTEHLPPEGGPSQLLRSCPTGSEKGAQTAQGALDLACLGMRTRERQRRLSLMARLSAHGGEEQRPTRDGFRMSLGNR